MSVSKVSLSNKALTLCGASPITSLSDETQNARVVNRIYEISRKSILGEGMWTFALTRTTLTVSADAMAWYETDEAYVYTRPSNAVRIFGVSDKYATWREEGDYIISDTASLGIVFVHDHDNPAKYPPAFLEAFIDKLCSDICFMLLHSATKAEAFLKKYNEVSLPKALSANSQTGKFMKIIDDAWERSKFYNNNPEA